MEEKRLDCGVTEPGPIRRIRHTGAVPGAGREREETMPEITLDTSQMPWGEAVAYPRGTMVKVLRDEGEARSILLKLPPGFEMEVHSHTCCEQHFVLEGRYEAAGMEYGPGAYRRIPAHTDHGPFFSREGAVVLVIWA
jgi:anti-sigma factor ChrR (cupin superfamily)